VPGGHRRPAEVRELLGVELDRQPEFAARTKTCSTSSTVKAIVSQKASTASASPSAATAGSASSQTSRR
jgi:hypothetical protein